MKKLLTISVFVLSGFTINKLSAQIVNIPDANFKAFLVANSSINTNANTEIEVSEAAAYSGSIFAGTQGIADLTGIEAFTSLTVLDVSQNSLSSIDVSNNTALINLNCSFNGLTCVDVSNNPNLTDLDCSYNNLSKLNIKNGNSGILINMNCTSNSMLVCIQVDNVAAAMGATGWIKDPWSSYSALCTQPIADFTSNAPVCFGNPITFTENSVNESAWYWNFGDGDTSTLPNPVHTYLTTNDFTVMHIAKNCYGKDTFELIISQGKAIYGNASYSGGPINGGFAILHPFQAMYTSFDSLQVVTIDALGDYYFPNVIEGNYIIKIFPDTTNNPTLVSTYYSNTWAWDSANVIVHGCTADDVINITMVEAVGTAGGLGHLHGTVIEGNGFGRAQGDPVHGVDVKLGITGTNVVVARTTTDALGEYVFPNLAFGNYSVYVDIPGLLRDSVYDVVVDAVNYQYPDLNYLVDSAAIYVLPNIGIDEESNDDPSYRIFPNPVKDQATILYTVNSNSNIKLDIYNISGVKLLSLVNSEQEPGNYTYTFNAKNSQLKSGIYFVTLSGDGKTKTRRIIITE